MPTPRQKALLLDRGHYLLVVPPTADLKGSEDSLLALLGAGVTGTGRCSFGTSEWRLGAVPPVGLWGGEPGQRLCGCVCGELGVEVPASACLQVCCHWKGPGEPGACWAGPVGRSCNAQHTYAGHTMQNTAHVDPELIGFAHCVIY
jgi:hypothetical protein